MAIQTAIGGVAQLVERRTGTPLRQVRLPVRQKILHPQSTFSADSLTLFLHPRVQPHALTFVRTLKTL